MIGRSHRPGWFRRLSQIFPFFAMAVAPIPVLAQVADSSMGVYGSVGTVTNADDRYSQPLYGEVGFLYQSGNLVFGLGYADIEGMDHSNTDVHATIEQAGPYVQVGYEWQPGSIDVAVSGGVMALRRTAYFNNREVYDDTETLPFVEAKALWPMWQRAEGYVGLKIINDSSSDTWVVPAVGVRMMF